MAVAVLRIDLRSICTAESPRQDITESQFHPQMGLSSGIFINIIKRFYYRFFSKNNYDENRRRDSLGLAGSPARELEHPSTFPSLLRRDRHSPSVTPPRRDTPSPTHRVHNKRHSMGSFPNLSRSNIVNYNRRDSISSNGIRDMKRDYVGSTNSLSRKSSIDTKKSSTDSLDVWHSNNWESERTNSVSSLVHDERVSYGHNKVIYW